MGEWVPVLRDFGFPIALLVMLFWALWKGGSWTATNILLPLTRAHIGFLESVNRDLSAQTQLMREFRDLLKGQTALIQTAMNSHDHGHPERRGPDQQQA